MFNVDETLGASDNLLFETAMEEIPASLDAEVVEKFQELLYYEESGKRIRAVNQQLRKAALLYNLNGLKIKQL